MAASKRSWEGNVIERSQEDVEMTSPEQESPVHSLFTFIRGELDEHHDRRERVVKASRDITALSKKMYVHSSVCYIRWEENNQTDD